MARRRLLAGATAVTGGMLLGVAGWAPGTAVAAARPLVHDRSTWRARRPKRRAVVLDRAPDRIVIHHSATPNSSDYSLKHAYRLSRAIQDYHMDRNGWDDIGQQLTVSRGGHILEGRNGSLKAISRGRHIVGAQTASHNTHTIGIENEGLYTSARVPVRLFDALVELCAWLCTVYDLDPRRAIVGHRDLNATACPGDAFYRRLPELRRHVARAMGLRTRMDSPPLPPHVTPHPGATAPFDHGPALGPGESG
ncbi:MAG: N-acetylmuramoyl-L-alanine amidase [Streptosporangiales bacterium]|nr:N-acetylmuramoyl-L-alanine amidase [Streptosporangiales bacterium]